MKYVINTRGRKVRIEDRDLQDLVQKGFVEISEQDFNSQSYIKDLDKKTDKENTDQQAKNKVIKETSFFRTRIV